MAGKRKKNYGASEKMGKEAALNSKYDSRFCVNRYLGGVEASITRIWFIPRKNGLKIDRENVQKTECE